MNIGYKRVSSSDQNTDRQLLGIPIDRDYVDIASGKHAERPQLQAMLMNIRPGDVVYIHELSRLGRSVKDLLKIVETIISEGGTVKFLKENLTFSSGEKNSFQSLMLNLLSSIAQFERDLLLERQREGIAIAKQKGKFKGKKSKFTLSEVNRIRQAFEETRNKQQLAKDLGISRSYLYELVKNAEHKQLRA